MRKIHPFLWFDGQAEAAANFYVSIFPDSKILQMSRGADGEVFTADFEIAGARFSALNGGPHFKFTEAISFWVDCKDQAEVDYYWDRLVDGGQPSRCGWLKDRFGVSWQVVPDVLGALLGDPDPAKAQRAHAAMMKMIKLDIAELKRAHAG